MSTSLLTTYSDKSSTSFLADLSLSIEQVVPEKIDKYATLHDLYKAWSLSASGISARRDRIKSCPIEFDGTLVRFFLGFYVWPSEEGLEHDLTASIGSIGEELKVKVEKVVYDFIDNESEYTLPYYMENLSIDWTTKTYNSHSDIISEPGHSSAGKEIKFSKEVFGEAEIKGKAIGSYYILTIELDKEYWIPKEDEDGPIPGIADEVVVGDFSPEEMNSFSISNLAVSVSASYKDREGKLQTVIEKFEIPECVQKVLEYCPGDEIMYYLSWCEESSDRQVYYSTCDGEVLDVRDGINPQDYCTNIAMEYDPGPWLKTLR